MKIRISIIGATGYTGGELLRILMRHPHADIRRCTSESSSGKTAGSFHGFGLVHGQADWVLEKCSVQRVAADSDVAFLCLPHGESARKAAELLKRGVKVIDLSADYRLKSPRVYEQWYEQKHPHPELLKEAVYGLPERYREKIRGARLIANPGCYATASILSVLPLMENRLTEGSLVIDAKSGVSGAGKKPDPRYLFSELSENFFAYGVACHRHLPEIEQELARAGGKKVGVTFVPHLLPVRRGILVSVYAGLKKKMTTRALWETYARRYEKEPYVVLLPEGEFPQIKLVRQTNFCHIGVKVDSVNRRAVIVGVIDNLSKGAGSQAVQNMNLMFGLEETCGL